MFEVGVHEAKTTLSSLLRRVATGEEITINSGGKPVAKLVAVHRGDERVFGLDEGVFDVPDDFDAPLPPALQRYFA